MFVLPNFIAKII